MQLTVFNGVATLERVGITTGWRSLFNSAVVDGLRFFLCDEEDRNPLGLRRDETTKLLSLGTRFGPDSNDSFETAGAEVVENDLLLDAKLLVVGIYGLRVDVEVVVVDVN